MGLGKTQLYQRFIDFQMSCLHKKVILLNRMAFLYSNNSNSGYVIAIFRKSKLMDSRICLFIYLSSSSDKSP